MEIICMKCQTLFSGKNKNITKTYLYNFNPLKPHFYIVKLGFTGYTLFFLFLLKNIDCVYSLEPPLRGGSNVYPQSMFRAEIWKISEFISGNFQFLVVKFSIYLNRLVFIMVIYHAGDTFCDISFFYLFVCLFVFLFFFGFFFGFFLYFFFFFFFFCTTAGLGFSVGCASDWWSGCRGFDSRRVRQHYFVEMHHEILKYFLRSYFPFHWFKNGSCKFLAKKKKKWAL